MRDSHRADAERLLVRAVEEEVRRSGGRTDAERAAGAGAGGAGHDGAGAAEEYAAYTRRWTRRRPAGPLGQRFSREGWERPCW